MRDRPGPEQGDQLQRRTPEQSPELPLPPEARQDSQPLELLFRADEHRGRPPERVLELVARFRALRDLPEDTLGDDREKVLKHIAAACDLIDQAQLGRIAERLENET